MLWVALQQGVLYLIVRAPIDRSRGPGKGGELFSQIAQRQSAAVVIDNDAGEIWEGEIAREENRFPDAALIALSIADQYEDAPLALFSAQRQGNAYRHRESVDRIANFSIRRFYL